MEEKIFAGLLTWALVIAFIFSIEALAQLRASEPQKSTISKALTSDFKILNEQVP